MANIDYEALTEQVMAQGIALSKPNFRVVDESNQNSRDFINEPLYVGTETASPVTLSGGKVRNAISFEFGQRLEGDLIELIKDYRCVWDVLCGAYKANQKKTTGLEDDCHKVEGRWCSKVYCFYASPHISGHFFTW